jgi:hypothetical protein
MEIRKTKILLACTPSACGCLKLFTEVWSMKRQIIWLGPPDDELGRTVRNTVTATSQEAGSSDWDMNSVPLGYEARTEAARPYRHSWPSPEAPK